MNENIIEKYFPGPAVNEVLISSKKLNKNDSNLPSLFFIFAAVTAVYVCLELLDDLSEDKK